jgi:hypothetical protein
MGPGGGEHGGQIVSQGTPEDLAADPNSQTGRYLKLALEAAGPARPPSSPPKARAPSTPPPARNSPSSPPPTSSRRRR